jgi:hypothetical protein
VGLCCGSGMFSPVSGSKHFFILDPTSKVECKLNFFLAFCAFRSKVIVIVKKIRELEKIHLESPIQGVKKHRIRIRNTVWDPLFYAGFLCCRSDTTWYRYSDTAE